MTGSAICALVRLMHLCKVWLFDKKTFIFVKFFFLLTETFFLKSDPFFSKLQRWA